MHIAFEGLLDGPEDAGESLASVVAEQRGGFAAAGEIGPKRFDGPLRHLQPRASGLPSGSAVMAGSRSSS